MYSVHDENDHKLNVITLVKSDLERKGLYQSKRALQVHKFYQK